MTIKGTKNDDDLAGTSGNDMFNMAQGGDDVVHGGLGDDTFQYGKWLTAADHIDGGGGTDTLVIAGDYSGANALVFASDTITKVEMLQLRAGFDYDVTLANLTGVFSHLFTVDARALGAANGLTLDASAVNLTQMVMIGGAGDDVLTGGTYFNTFDLTRGGDDTALGGGKDDVFLLGRGLSAGDRIDGGGGVNTLELQGRYGDQGFPTPFTFDEATIANIQNIKLLGNFDYALKFADGNLAAGQTLTIDASTLGPHRTVTIDASAESDGAYIMLASAGDNTLIGGAKNDSFRFDGDFGAGDVVDGGAGFDTLAFGEVSGLVLTPAGISNIELFTFTGTSDVTVTGAFSELRLDGSAATSFAADAGDASVSQVLVFKGGAGDDTLVLGAAPNATLVSVDGGTGVDTLVFDAPSATLDLGIDFKSFETIVLKGATSTYDVTLHTSFDPTESMTVDASALSDPSSSLQLDASHQGSNFLHVIGGAGGDAIIASSGFDTIDGGAGDDVITGGAKGDTLTGGSGSDIFVYATAIESNAHVTDYDRITDFDANTDFLRLPFAVTYDGETSGSVTRPAQDLAQIVNPLLTAHGAVLVDVTGGHLAGHILLAIDADNDGTFTSADYVIDLTGMTNAASFGAADFVT